MFKKLKKFYKNNRIYCILMLVSLCCFILMGSAVVIYFVSQASSSNYGNRLSGIEDYDTDKEIEALKTYYQTAEKAKEIEVRMQGKIIYVNIKMDSKTTNEEIQNLATTSLEKMSAEARSFFDIQFIFTRDEYAPYLGSKSASNTVITWARYRFDSEETTTTKK